MIPIQKSDYLLVPIHVLQTWVQFHFFLLEFPFQIFFFIPSLMAIPIYIYIFLFKIPIPIPKF